MSDEVKKDRDTEISSITYMVNMPYNYNAGYYVSRYLTELQKNKRIIGVKCPKCGKVYVPPRVTCRECFVRMEEFVPVSEKGTVIAFTVTSVPYTNPNTGEPKKLPFTAAYIRLDGSNSNILHCLEELDEKNLETGMRVQAVFSENRTGDHFTDIKYFRTIKE